MEHEHYPRWLYKGNDLNQGVIVKDKQEAEQAEAMDGYSEYRPDAKEPEKSKKGKKPDAP